jgi:hypothetical protein
VYPKEMRKKFANIIIFSIIYHYIHAWKGIAKIYPSRDVPVAPKRAA